MNVDEVLAGIVERNNAARMEMQQVTRSIQHAAATGDWDGFSEQLDRITEPKAGAAVPARQARTFTTTVEAKGG